MTAPHLAGLQSAHHPSHGAVSMALRSGELSAPGRCLSCGVAQSGAGTTGQRVVWHHASYRPEHRLHVVPLCRSCHKLVHHGRIPDPGLLIVTYPCAAEYDALDPVKP